MRSTAGSIPPAARLLSKDQRTVGRAEHVHKDPWNIGGKTHLRGLTIPALGEFVESLGQPPYRARQLASWLYEKLPDDVSAMTDLPLGFREGLRDRALVSSFCGCSVQESKVDGTRKYLFELHDGNMVESVLMRHGRRITFCVSSQVGCPLDCRFCETAKGQFRRNLSAGEILDEICHLKKDCLGDADKVNIVFMGMGEPLLNYRSLVQAVGVINSAPGFELGSKRVTISTSGLPRRMKNLADEALRCSLALSLNATTDAKRRELMPAVSKYTIEEIIDAARYYEKRSGRRVTLEYVMLRGVNTSPTDARRLGKIARSGPFKVNLIPYNPGRAGEFEAPDEEDLQAFIRGLLPYAPTVTVRRSKGPDIFAACGQLWTKSLGARASEDPARD
jgi:23S rRNA (adenine2503-C2)-methyltransferase